MTKNIFTLLIFLFVGFTGNLNAQSLTDSVKVPNVFTPNLDGINDVFKPNISLESEIKTYELIVYDRYGVQVFQTLKSKQVWDGRTTSGLLCSEGTYFYVLELIVNTEKLEYKGFVQLFR